MLRGTGSHGPGLTGRLLAGLACLRCCGLTMLAPTGMGSGTWVLGTLRPHAGERSPEGPAHAITVAYATVSRSIGPVLSPMFATPPTPSLSSSARCRFASGVSSRVLDVPSAAQRARAAARQQDRQAARRVQVAVGHARAVDDHHVVEQRAVAVRRVAQLVEVVGEQRRVMDVDLRQVRQLRPDRRGGARSDDATSATPICGYDRPLSSRAIMNVMTRVRSVW